MDDGKNIVVFQGVRGANSEIACVNCYPDMARISVPTFEDVFTKVENKEAKYGVIPIENLYAGRVAEIHNLLRNTNLYIVAEYFQKIEHHLVAIKGTKLSDIKQIYSHPQALMQCNKFILDGRYNKVDFSNTATAAEFVAKEKRNDIAAICSDLAAKEYDLEIIARDIGDVKDNYTVFITIAKNAINPEDSDNYKNNPQSKVATTLLFTIRNIPASLYKALGGFATNGVNILKLESYIPAGISSEAQFYITFEGSAKSRSVQLALEELGFFCKKVKFLGSYISDPKR